MPARYTSAGFSIVKHGAAQTGGKPSSSAMIVVTERSGCAHATEGMATNAAMAVTIIFGLMVATVLTMIVVPVLYAILYGAPNPAPDGAVAHE